MLVWLIINEYDDELITHTRAHAHAHTNTHTRAHTQSRMCTHAHTWTHTLPQTHTHTRALKPEWWSVKSLLTSGSARLTIVTIKSMVYLWAKMPDQMAFLMPTFFNCLFWRRSGKLYGAHASINMPILLLCTHTFTGVLFLVPEVIDCFPSPVYRRRKPIQVNFPS